MVFTPVLIHTLHSRVPLSEPERAQDESTSRATDAGRPLHRPRSSATGLAGSHR